MSSHDVILNDFREVYSPTKFCMPLITIYNHPTDYPDKWVARLFNLEQATIYIVLADTVEEIESKMPAGMVRLPPDEGDNPCIEEVFI